MGDWVLVAMLLIVGCVLLGVGVGVAYFLVRKRRSVAGTFVVTAFKNPAFIGVSAPEPDDVVNRTLQNATYVEAASLGLFAGQSDDAVYTLVDPAFGTQDFGFGYIDVSPHPAGVGTGDIDVLPHPAGFGSGYIDVSPHPEGVNYKDMYPERPAPGFRGRYSSGGKGGGRQNPYLDGKPGQRPGQKSGYLEVHPLPAFQQNPVFVGVAVLSIGGGAPGKLKHRPCPPAGDATEAGGRSAQAHAALPSMERGRCNWPAFDEPDITIDSALPLHDDWGGFDGDGDEGGYEI